MARRGLTTEQLARLKLLNELPPDTILLTEDAALYSGASVPTWERDRAAGRTPPAYRVTRRTLGYRKKDLDARLAALREGSCNAELVNACADGELPREKVSASRPKPPVTRRGQPEAEPAPRRKRLPASEPASVNA